MWVQYRQTMRLFAVVFVMTYMLVDVQASASPPEDFIDLSSKNLSSVPRDLPHTAVAVDLSRNHINQLLRGDFASTPFLKFLNVSWNHLQDIDPETFLDTPLLEYLDLSHNSLKNLSGQTYLLRIRNLLMLNLTWNEIPTMTLGSEFSSLANLKVLAVGAKNISVGDFEYVAKVKLQTLTLCLENEVEYEKDSLGDVQAHTLQVVFGSLQTIAPDLISDALQLFVEVELMNLTSDFQSLSELLKERAEIHTQQLHLKNVAMNWRDLTQLVNAALRASIAHFTMSDVVLFNMPYIETKVASASQTKSFAIRRAVVKSFFFDQEIVYNFFVNMPVENLALTGTSIIHMTCPKVQSPIVQLDFSHCAISDSIFSRVEGQEFVDCENLANVTSLTLVDNNLKNLQVLSQRFQYMTSLQHLDLSLNSIVYDVVTECRWPSSIAVLNLSSNSLADLVFYCLPKELKTLDLQNNQVLSVPSSVSQLKNLLFLNLNANRLLDLPVCNTFPGLNELLLKSNSLHAPSVSRLKNCTKLKTLDVSHNPFTCTCLLRSFVSLGIASEGTKSHRGIELLSWPVDYYCTYPEAVRDSSLKEISLPEVSCNVWLLAATILIPAVVLIVTTVVLCNHLDVPWYIGMIWQWTRAKHRARKQQVDAENLTGVEFHAFVSYSQHDADWVRGSLLPNLEGPSGRLRISHHERNFVPGKTIIENIISCIEKSRRSVFVLSAHFVKSEWCHYELYFATHQRLSRGMDSIVLVLLEPLPQYLIPSKYYQLKSMMSRHTYLEWPQDSAKQRMFWANLRAALQANLPNAPETEILD